MSRSAYISIYLETIRSVDEFHLFYKDYDRPMTARNDAGNLLEILNQNLEKDNVDWLQGRINSILESRDVQGLYLTYSILAGKVGSVPLTELSGSDETSTYLRTQQANRLELSRIYLLAAVLEKDFSFFSPRVSQIIQVADQGEMVTFLKYLILLPQSEYFKSAAVESLRTNITPVFEAISMDNPYPAKNFNDQQWNQMYLKAAFMQLDLSRIMSVDNRANADLARIISDYAHERWAASRTIDPTIWRPVTGFMNTGLRADMKRLLESNDQAECRAAALCCLASGDEEATEFLISYPDLKIAIEENEFDWNNFKE